MKYLWTLVILFVATFLIGRFNKKTAIVEQTPEYQTQVFKKTTPPAAQDQRSKLPRQQPTTSTATSRPAIPTPSRDLTSTKGPELFSYLYDTNFQSEPLSSAQFAQVKQRFSARYPAARLSKHVSPLESELKDRIGILKATGSISRRFPGSTTSKELTRLYQQLVQNSHENFFVRRQALRNLASVSTAAGEIAHRKWLRSLDPHLLATSALDEREMVEVILEP